jgi:multidomain signaling protein FimX
VTTVSPELAITQLLVVAGNSARDTVAVNKLISTLRSDGLALRPALANDEHAISRLLANEQWDLLLYFDTASCSIDSLLALFNKHQLALPIVFVGSQTPSEAKAQILYSKRISTALGLDQPSRLLAGIRKEAGFIQLQKRLRRLELSFHDLETRHERLLEESPLAIAYVRDGIHLYCNQSYADIFAFANRDSIRTTPLLNLVASSERPALKTLLQEAALDTRSGVFQARQQDGSETALQMDFSPVTWQGKPCLQMTVQVPAGNPDYSAELVRLNKQDLLTQLDSRHHFINRIEAAIRDALQKGRFSTLLLLQIEDFDEIIATIGKPAGNLVLGDIALFLQQSIAIPLAAGRLDDHIFGILLEGGDPDAGLALCDKVRTNVTNRISSAMLSSLELRCTIGMALINGNATDSTALLERARQAARQPVSGSGGKLFRIGDTLQHDATDMLDYLGIALAERRFKPVFQPIVSLEGNNRRFYEVLIRMLDQDGNEVVPGAFLPLANLNGLGEQIDRLVIDLAIQSLQANKEDLLLTVNITDNTLQSLTFLPWLSEQLRSSRVPADRLLIDVSEIALQALGDQALQFCQGLDELGVGLTISHFGGGLDPFALLNHFSPQFVTLDETVVRDLMYSAPQQAHVQSLVTSLHARNLQVVTPRVEDMAALPVIWEIGVDFVQGYSVQAPSHEMNYEFVKDEEITLSAPPQ